MDVEAAPTRLLQGRRLGVRLGETHVEGVLESHRLERRGGHHRARLWLSDVECEGLRFDALSVVAESIEHTPAPHLALSASGGELEGRATLASLITWLEPKLPQWRLGLTKDGHIEAVARRGGRRFVIEPAVLDGKPDVELRAAGWRNVKVQMPRWLRVTRTLPLSGLPDGMSVSEARRCGTSVYLRLTVNCGP